MATVGERIKARRLELALTQDELARQAGISKSFLSDVENCKRNVSADNLLDISRVLNLSLDFLMKGEDADPPSGSAKEEKVTPSDVRIPSALSAFAAERGLTYREMLALLGMKEQIIAHRKKHDRSSDFDWAKFYERVKDFL